MQEIHCFRKVIARRGFYVIWYMQDFGSSDLR